MSAAAELTALRERVKAEPRAVLTATDRVNLRTLATFGPAMKQKGFYMLNGRRFSYASLHRFEILHLAADEYRKGKGIFLELNATGKAVAASLFPRSGFADRLGSRPDATGTPNPPADPSSSPQLTPSRAWWID